VKNKEERKKKLCIGIYNTKNNTQIMQTSGGSNVKKGGAAGVQQQRGSAQVSQAIATQRAAIGQSK
jgi:hypothetical protein